MKEYKGSTSYEDSFQSIQALNLFQKLEELNTELSEVTKHQVTE